MIVLRVNCLKTNNKEDFFQYIHSEFNKVTMTYLNDMETIDCYSINNIDALWDILNSFNFDENPCMCIIYNFNHCRSFFSEDEVNILTSILNRLANDYTDNFKFLMFENDANVKINTTQIEVVDILNNIQ